MESIKLATALTIAMIVLSAFTSSGTMAQEFVAAPAPSPSMESAGMALQVPALLAVIVSGSNPTMYQEFMKEQYELDRKAKMEVIAQESEERRPLIHSQRIAEDMKVLQIDTRGMDPADTAIINAQKARIRATYPLPPN
nr:MLO-related protein [Tanacetum cinerariifolium]